MSPLDACRRWVEDVVLGLDLCPFAHAPMRAGEVRFVEAAGADFDAAVRAALGEVEHLAAHADVETTLVVYASGLETFDAMLELTGTVEAALEAAGLDGDVQVVGFHPAFRFAEADPADPANAVNRSPHPMLHLLRASSVERAIARHPDPEGIPARNAATLRGRRES